MKVIKVDSWELGGTFSDAAKSAQKTAIENKCLVEFVFNEVVCLVDSKTNLKWLLRDYLNSWTMGWKEVGPSCLANYSPSVQAEFEKKTKEREDREEKQREEWRKKDEKERSEFEEQVKGIELELKDPARWAKSREVNNDGYGGAALDYAECWAKKMQIEISKGKTVAECADETQNGLGFLGITGFQFGCAMRVLSQTWKHGEELRVWHNAKYNHKGKGVVNPAVFTIGG